MWGVSFFCADGDASESVVFKWKSVGMCWNCCGEVNLKILHIMAKNSSRHF